MDEVIRILMRRDEISYNESYEIVSECIEAIKEEMSGRCSMMVVEDIVADYLGLEPDYLIYLLEDM